MTQQEQAARFMLEWLRTHMLTTWPRGQAPASLWDRRVREYHRRAWDALYQAHPELYQAARAAGVADTWRLVEALWSSNRGNASA